MVFKSLRSASRIISICRILKNKFYWCLITNMKKFKLQKFKNCNFNNKLLQSKHCIFLWLSHTLTFLALFYILYFIYYTLLKTSSRFWDTVCCYILKPGITCFVMIFLPRLQKYIVFWKCSLLVTEALYNIRKKNSHPAYSSQFIYVC
jgi:hypothetical protein